MAFSLFGAGSAWATPHHVIEKIAGVTFNFSAGTVEAEGSGAADLHAPNAQIARVTAERTARAVIAKRVLAAIAALSSERLGCKGAPAEKGQVEKAAAAAPPTSIEWFTDGSVTMTVALPFAEIVAPSAAPTPIAAPVAATFTPAATDGGSPAPSAILVDPAAHPSVLVSRDGHCTVAPPLFETLADARASGGELATAPTAEAAHHPKNARAAATPHPGFDHQRPRFIAVVRASDEKHAPLPDPRNNPKR